MRSSILRLALLFPIVLGAGAAVAAEGDELLGTRPPEWTAEHWLNTEPLTLEELRGRVVLVRFWTGPGCPYCRASAPALNEWHERFADDGLTVVALYHHKGRGGRDGADPGAVAAYAEELGFELPVAIDPGWRTLRAWWLDGHLRGWTSVSFLLDRKGVIRHVHPGGQYVEGDEAYAEMEAALERLLAEPAGSGVGRTRIRAPAHYGSSRFSNGSCLFQRYVLKSRVSVQSIRPWPSSSASRTSEASARSIGRSA